MASQQIQSVREAFFVHLDHGIRGAPEEEQFAQLLIAKDLAYLSLYVAEGMESSRERINGIDVLTGGKLDGGIVEGDSFAAWVSAVREKLGYDAEGTLIFISPSEQLFITAIQATEKTYRAYKQARDIDEFKKWRSSRRLVASPASLPEEYAARYIDYVVKPAFSEALLEIPLDKRDVTESAIEVWGDHLRNAIIECEKIDVTPAKVVSYLKANGYTPEQISLFSSKIANISFEKSSDATRVLSNAVSEVLLQTNNRADPESFNYKSINIEFYIKEWIYGNEAGKITGASAAPDAADNKLDHILFDERPLSVGMIPYIRLGAI